MSINMDGSQRASSRRKTVLETIAISRLLELHIKPLGEGRCEYVEGWDDEAIAKAVAPDLLAGHVSSVRAEMFGTIRSKRSSSEQVSPDRFEELEHLVLKLVEANTTLSATLAALTTKYDALCDGLSIARVVDARHLKVKATHFPPREVANGAANVTGEAAMAKVRGSGFQAGSN